MAYTFDEVMRKHYKHTFIAPVNEKIVPYPDNLKLVTHRVNGLGIARETLKILTCLYQGFKLFRNAAYCQCVRYMAYKMVEERIDSHFIFKIHEYELANSCYMGYMQETPLTNTEAEFRNREWYASYYITNRCNELYTRAHNRLMAFLDGTEAGFDYELEKIKILLSLFDKELTNYNWLDYKEIGIKYNQIIKTNVGCQILTDMSLRIGRAYPYEYRIIISNANHEEIMMLMLVLMHYGLKKVIYRQIVNEPSNISCKCKLYDRHSETCNQLNVSTRVSLRLQATEIILEKIQCDKKVIIYFDKDVLREATRALKRGLNKTEAENEWLLYMRMTRNSNRTDYFIYVYDVIERIVEQCWFDMIDLQQGTVTLNWPDGRRSKYYARIGDGTYTGYWATIADRGWRYNAVRDEGKNLTHICTELARGAEILILSKFLTLDINQVQYKRKSVTSGEAFRDIFDILQRVIHAKDIKGYKLKSCCIANNGLNIGDGSNDIQYITHDYLVDIAATFTADDNDLDAITKILVKCVNGVIGGMNHK